MSKYKLYYFPVKGRAEPIRMALHYANVPFDDIRVAQSEWPKMKPKMPQGTMPVLVEGEKRLSQTFAIAKFIANKYGLAGKTEWEKARVDEAIATFVDFSTANQEYFYVLAGVNEGDKDELFRRVAQPAADRYFPIFEKMLQKHGDHFIAGKNPTIADFFLSEYFSSLRGAAPTLFNSHKTLTDYVHRVHAIPQLKSYLKSRPHTDF